MGDIAPRQVIADNLNRLMRESVRHRTLELLSKSCGISRGTLDRIRRAAVSTGVDQLEAIGKAFGLEPYELLTPAAQAKPENVSRLPTREAGPKRSIESPIHKEATAKKAKTSKKGSP